MSVHNTVLFIQQLKIIIFMLVQGKIRSFIPIEDCKKSDAKEKKSV
jgi:hypothetical protein